ncbi:MAG: deoxynucleoside kinase, partial [candidate division Zixibacteria bacterium]|nr:deoxynucleoside kinase [candidate division Zixibacteria bacterium]
MAEINYINIEGAIGAGKTSLAKTLAEEMDARLILEETEENPFLPDFYKDKRRYAFQTQLFFLLSRHKQQQELFATDLFHKK